MGLRSGDGADRPPLFYGPLMLKLAGASPVLARVPAPVTVASGAGPVAAGSRRTTATAVALLPMAPITSCWVSATIASAVVSRSVTQLAVALLSVTSPSTNWFSTGAGGAGRSPSGVVVTESV